MRSRLLAVVFAILLIATPMAGVAGAQEDGTELPTPPEADSAYVTDDGDVVLVYEEQAQAPTDGTVSTANFGIDLTEGIAHALFVQNMTSTSETTGEFTTVLDPDRLAANGSLATPSPDALSSFSLDASVVQSDTESNGAFSLNAGIDESAGVSGFVESADFQNELRVGPDRLTADGQLSFTTGFSSGTEQSQSFTVTEDESGYTLDASQSRPVYSYSGESWNTRAAAKETITQQYGSLATQLGGEASVTLESHSYTNATDSYADGMVDVEFTVEYTGIDDGLAEQVATTLASSEQYDLTQAEAETIGEQVAEIQINEAGFSTSTSDGTNEYSYTADIENYDGALRAYYTVLQSVSGAAGTSLPASYNASFERVQQTLDAQQESGMVQTFTLDGSVSQADAGTDVTLNANYETENWEAYRQALADRGIEVANTEMSLQAGLNGDQITAEGSLTVEQDQLVSNMVSSITNTTEDGSDVSRLAQAFEDAGFQRARTDISVSDGQVRMEAGASFRNMQQLTSMYQQLSGAESIPSSIVGEQTESGGNVYMRLSGAVSADATEEDVRALEPVGEDTEVNLAGEYNRTFPTVDVENAYNYLNIDRSTATGTSTGSQPGFGVAIALLAFAGAAFLVRRA
ncbi:MAG: PGF-CTERM sorting domain-containing protein [Halobacteriales archaeon]|nr:PGF-CTERM sorting domain-containing protein [Halobacteriales archaeon]